MTVYDFQDYRSFLESTLVKLPKKGHGVLSQWAKVLKVSTTLMSQILSSKKSLSLEMAHSLCRHLNLTLKETDYFILLVEYDRSGTRDLKDYFRTKITELQKESQFFKNRIENAVELSSEARAIYYSNWAYAGITNLVACSGISTVEEVALALRLPRHTIVDALAFLVRQCIVIEKKQGWELGPQNTYLSSDSPLVQQHHQNWRLRATNIMNERSPEDLFYTSPLSLSEELARKLRRRLVEVIEEIQKKVGPSPSETIRCLNIDFFKF